MRFLKFILPTLIMGVSPYAHSLSQPDAGQILRDTLSQPPTPFESNLDLDILTEPLIETAHGGRTVQITQVVFEGNSVIDSSALHKALGELAAEPYDLAAMRALANKITLFYREQGYPFARAYLPAQRLTDGKLIIALLEGRYGQVKAVGSHADKVQSFLHPLQPGSVIESNQLERVALIIADIPGIRVIPVLQPGAETGEADLILEVTESEGFTGLVNIDNHGNRFTGAKRLLGNVILHPRLVFGDQLSISAMVTDENMVFGSLSYQLPVASDGLIAELNYVRTEYELAKDFSVLEATGIAEVYSVGARYPIIRSQNANLALSATLQYKRFNDEVGIQNSQRDNSSTALPIAFNFDKRDQLGFGGISYGSATFTWGNLHLADTQDRINDELTAQTQGQFQKINLDVARIQALNTTFTGFARLNRQWAKANLDSSEKMSIGGPRAVRAYPIGEGSADRATLVQFELRYRLNHAISPYGFVDIARTEVNARPFDPNATNTREYSGGGLGVRYNYQAWRSEVMAAWRWGGGQPVSDPRDDTPRLWANISYQF